MEAAGESGRPQEADRAVWQRPKGRAGRVEGRHAVVQGALGDRGGLGGGVCGRAREQTGGFRRQESLGVVGEPGEGAGGPRGQLLVVLLCSALDLCPPSAVHPTPRGLPPPPWPFLVPFHVRHLFPKNPLPDTPKVGLRPIALSKMLLSPPLSPALRFYLLILETFNYEKFQRTQKQRK